MKKLLLLLLSLLPLSSYAQFDFTDILQQYQPTIVESESSDPVLDYLKSFTSSRYSTLGTSQSQPKQITPKNPSQIINGYYLNSLNEWTSYPLKITWDNKGYYVSHIRQYDQWCKTQKVYIKELTKYDKYFQYFTYKVNISTLTIYF